MTRQSPTGGKRRGTLREGRPVECRRFVNERRIGLQAQRCRTDSDLACEIAASTALVYRAKRQRAVSRLGNFVLGRFARYTKARRLAESHRATEMVRRLTGLKVALSVEAISNGPVNSGDLRGDPARHFNLRFSARRRDTKPTRTDTKNNIVLDRVILTKYLSA